MRVFDSGVKIVETKGQDMSLWDDFNEARDAYNSYLADPYEAGSDEDNDCVLENLIQLTDTALRLIDSLKGDNG